MSFAKNLADRIANSAELTRLEYEFTNNPRQCVSTTLDANTARRLGLIVSDSQRDGVTVSLPVPSQWGDH